MFIDVAQEAFSTIATWQFWSVVVISSIVMILGMSLLTFAMALPKIGPILAFVSVPVMFFIPSITITVGIILLIPIMIFRVESFGWDYLSCFGVVDFIKIAGAGFLGTLVAAFLPIIRGASIMALAQAAVVLSLSIRWLSNGAINVRPDFWTVAVMLVSVGIVIQAYFFLVTIVSSAVFGRQKEAMTMVYVTLHGSLLSYWAAAIYAGWIKVENFG